MSLAGFLPSLLCSGLKFLLYFIHFMCILSLRFSTLQCLPTLFFFFILLLPFVSLLLSFPGNGVGLMVVDKSARYLGNWTTLERCDDLNDKANGVDRRFGRGMVDVFTAKQIGSGSIIRTVVWLYIQINSKRSKILDIETVASKV
jgi:hypothetical protein